MKPRIQSSIPSQPDDIQSQPSTSTNHHHNFIRPLRGSGLETNSLTASIWTSSMISADSNTPSDMAFYRRASWLEEYALKRLRSIEDRSEARREEATTRKRSMFGSFLTACLPCSNSPKGVRNKPRSVVFSSQTSLTSMLEEKAEEEDQKVTQVHRNREPATHSQHLVMITSSL